MALLLGLPLALLGGMAGTLILLAVMYFAGESPPESYLLFFILSGFSVGALFAAPTTLIALPLAHFILVQRGRKHVAALPLTGLLSGALTMLVVALSTRRAHEVLALTRVFGIMCAGGIAGALCGFAFGRVLSGRRPSPPATPVDRDT